MIWLQKTRESFAAPEESASLVSIQDLASTFPQKNSGVSSGCAEVKLEQLFSVQRIPVLVSKDFRIPSFAFPPWGLQLDLRRCQVFRCRDPVLLLVLLVSQTFLYPLGTGYLLFSMC